jgi:hypothetical protein
MRKLTSPVEKLKRIENCGFNMGNVAYDGFLETNSLTSLKGAVSAYRLCMQAIRDQTKYKVTTNKRK